MRKIIYLYIKLPGLLNQKISPQNPFKANGYLVNTNSHVIHSLHCIPGPLECVWGIFVCVSVCVYYMYVGKWVWTFQRYGWRFSARPLGTRAEGVCKVIFEGAGGASAPTVTFSQFPVSLSLSPDAGIVGMHLCGWAEATKPGKQVHL